MTRAASGSPPEGRRRITSLRSSRDFSRVMRTGARARSGPIAIVGLPTDLGGPPRVGVVAGRRLGSAVTRNRVKRRVRAAAERARLFDSTDYVILPEPEAARVRFTELVEALSRAADHLRQKRVP